MTLPSHAIVNTAIGTSLGLDIPSLEAFVLGSLGPDIIEMIVCLGSFKRFFKIHRKFLHWWVVYLFILCVILIFSNVLPLEIVKYGTLFIAGCFAHLFFDLLTPTGIPVKTYNKRISFKVYTTGHIGELVIFIISIGVVFINVGRYV